MQLVKWIFSSYVTYILSFLSALLLAKKLGVQLYADWSLLVLYVGYLSQANLGVTHSYYISQIADKESTIKKQIFYLANGVFICLILIGLIFSIFVLNYIFRFVENEILLSYRIFLIVFSSGGAILVALFSNFYRLRNKMNRVILVSFISPLILIFSCFFLSGIILLKFLMFQLVLTPLISLILVVGPINRLLKVQISISVVRELLKKGAYLFLYNLSFYYILLVFRSFNSTYLSQHDFGIFSFSMVLTNSILLSIDAVAFAINSMQIKKSLNIRDVHEQVENIKKDNSKLTVLAILISALFLLFSPVILELTPEYKSSASTMPTLVFSILLNNLSAGNVIYLMSHKKILNLFISSIISLSVCTVILFLLQFYFGSGLFWFAIFVTFTLFSFLTSFFVIREIRNQYLVRIRLLDLVPIDLIVSSGLFIWLFHLSNLAYTVLFLLMFLIFNLSYLKVVFSFLVNFFLKSTNVK